MAVGVRRKGRQKPETGADFIPLAATVDRPAPAGSIVLVPGAEVPLLFLDLPRGLRGVSREQVAWRQMHDRMGLSPEIVEMRPFTGAGRADDWTRALVVEAASVAQWRDRAGPACRAVLPDYLALPVAEGLWSVAGDDLGVQVRLGPDDGFSTDAGTARRMLEQALSEAGTAPPRAVLIVAGDVPGLDSLLAAHDIPLLRDANEVTALGLDPPKRFGHGELAADLRTDPQAVRNRLRRRVLPWRWPVMLGLVAAGLWGAAQVVMTQRLEQAAAETRAATTAQVRAHFVPSGPILDIRTQVSRALATRRIAAEARTSRVSPLILFGQVAEVIGAARADTEDVSYNAVDGLAVRLHLPDFAAVDRLVQALEDVGIAVELSQARAVEGGGGVRAELRLSRAAAEDRP